MKSIVQLESESLELVRGLINAEGELSPEFEEKLKELESSWKDKADEVGYLMEALSFAAQNMRTKSLVFSAMGSKIQRAADRIKDELKKAMLNTDQKEIAGEDVVFKLTRAKAALEIDLDKLPKDYIEQQIIEKPNRQKIEQRLKTSQEQLPGVEIKEVWALRKYWASVKKIAQRVNESAK